MLWLREKEGERERSDAQPYSQGNINVKGRILELVECGCIGHLYPRASQCMLHRCYLAVRLWNCYWMQGQIQIKVIRNIRPAGWRYSLSKCAIHLEGVYSFVATVSYMTCVGVGLWSLWDPWSGTWMHFVFVTRSGTGPGLVVVRAKCQRALDEITTPILLHPSPTAKWQSSSRTVLGCSRTQLDVLGP